MKIEKTGSELGFLTKILYNFVCFYQYLTAGRPTPCRYVPTCSNYALDALEVHGSFHGIKLIFKRLIRCHPFEKSNGWDPVPGTDKDVSFKHENYLHEKACS
jgi:hypothetical protein|tara:strand:+ start:1422 stop:1727 length:306 start_codon:yes stop_codon:yes gene_type:complete